MTKRKGGRIMSYERQLEIIENFAQELEMLRANCEAQNQGCSSISVTIYNIPFITAALRLGVGELTRMNLRGEL